MSSTTIELIGELNLPGLTFLNFIPISNNPLPITLDGIEFEIFTLKKFINTLFDTNMSEDGTTDLVDVNVKRLFARFNIMVTDEDLVLLEQKKEPQSKTLNAYKKALSKLRRKTWEFARYELGQKLEILSYNTTPEISLYQQLTDGTYVLLDPNEERTYHLKFSKIDESIPFNRNDLQAYEKYINDNKKTDLCWILLMNSYDYMDHNNYRMAVIDACISIERVMKVKFANQLKQEDINGLDELFHAAGITKVIKYILPLIQDKHKISDELQKELVKSFALKNNIMHQSYYHVSENEAWKVIKTVSATLDIIIPRYLTMKRTSV